MPLALVSVSDKTGLIPFCQGLVGLGWELIASGGTARHLRDSDIPVNKVANYTQSPEVLQGRVKTLHPAIHAGLLARDTDLDRADLAEQGWRLIDMAVVNLYPFEQTIRQCEVILEEAIALIDIGGVALIRAAAKNFERVILATDPVDYPKILSMLKSGPLSKSFRRAMAVKGFKITAAYDHCINEYLSGESGETLAMFPIQTLRYGENPHQVASLYGYTPGQTPLGGELLHGKSLSYNNLLDLDSAWQAVVKFDEPAVVIVKHLSPCGIAVDNDILNAYQKALACDPISAFGSVVACNRVVDPSTANVMGDLFIECLIATGFSKGALPVLKQKKNLRLVQMPDLTIEPPFELRSVVRGILKQSLDMEDPEDKDWQVVTDRSPTEDEWSDLRFAWTAVQSVRSNAIVLVRGRATIGIGGGQPNRVDCVRIAHQRAGDKAQESAMASDAFFPFPDSIEIAAKAGVTSVIQPGGSRQDGQVIKAANQFNMTMVMTGVRHFRH